MKIDHLNFEYYKKALENILYENRDFNIKYAIVFSDLWQNPFESLLIPKLKELLKTVVCVFYLTFTECCSLKYCVYELPQLSYFFDFFYGHIEK